MEMSRSLPSKSRSACSSFAAASSCSETESSRECLSLSMRSSWIVCARVRMTAYSRYARSFHSRASGSMSMSSSSSTPKSSARSSSTTSIGFFDDDDAPRCGGSGFWGARGSAWAGGPTCVAGATPPGAPSCCCCGCTGGGGAAARDDGRRGGVGGPGAEDQRTTNSEGRPEGQSAVRELGEVERAVVAVDVGGVVGPGKFHAEAGDALEEVRALGFGEPLLVVGVLVVVVRHRAEGRADRVDVVDDLEARVGRRERRDLVERLEGVEAALVRSGAARAAKAGAAWVAALRRARVPAEQRAEAGDLDVVLGGLDGEAAKVGEHAGFALEPREALAAGENDVLDGSTD
mmetsp:Transcript_8535/g.35150  ORF Transcript_8535/g.35150 Transcript_8535/m.35150 type:complete len:347 (-) Transcript_8535:100-1140(-)